MVRIDLKARRVDMLIPDAELARRKAAYKPPKLEHQTPWEEIYRSTVGQLQGGMCMELATHYHRVVDKIPRHSH
jgi:xylonate dehydratase